MKSKAVFMLILTMLGLSVLACLGGGQTASPPSDSSGQSGGQSELEGNTWVLVEIGGGEPLSNGGALPTLTVIGDQASGNSSCNGWGAKVSVSGDSLQLSDFSGSEIFCDTPAGIMEQEQAFLQILMDAVRYEVTDDSLTIFSSSGATLVFQRF
jgi:heat shock protein HslJ